MNVRALSVTLATLAAAAAGAVAPAAASSAPTIVSTVTVVSARTAGRTSARTSARTSGTFARAVVRATNRQRVRHDRKRVKLSPCLTRYALAQAEAMARAGQIFHQALSPIQAGCRLSWVGENVAYGFQTGGDTVNQGWMLSARHRANLLDRHYRRVGVVAVEGAGGDWYVSQVFGHRA